MIGRYGVDYLSLDSLRVAIFIFIVGLFIRHPVVSAIGMAFVIFAYYRAFSKNLEKRRAENYRYMPFRQKLLKPFQRTKKRFADGKHYRFYRCEHCGSDLRVPKGKGKVAITCPKCGHKFEKRV